MSFYTVILSEWRFCMPTTKAKNLVYRLMLPFAPTCGKHPVISSAGSQTVMQMDSFRKIIRKSHVLGSSTFVSSGNRNVHILTKSDNPKHVPEDQTIYRVASITKIATALVILTLREKNLLDIDLPVINYLPFADIRESFEKVTLRHLLSHTSGIHDPEGLESMLTQQISGRLILRDIRMDSPGESFCYSNLGYGLVGAVAESVCNLNIQEIYRRYLFEPLRMNASLHPVTLDTDKILPVVRILPYHPGCETTITPLGRLPLDKPDPEKHLGYSAGSLYTDLPSLYRLISCLINEGKPILRHGISDMLKQHAAYGKISPDLSYGLGLLFIHDPYLSDHRIIGHQGFAYGCVDGAFWEEGTGNILISLNGGASELRKGRLGKLNRDLLHWAFREEVPLW